MLNMHILIALSEIISQCIFLSLSSVHELSKQRCSVGGGAPLGAITSTKLIQSPIANYYQLCCVVTQTESQGHREGHSPSIPSVLPALSKCNRKKVKQKSEERKDRRDGGKLCDENVFFVDLDNFINPFGRFPQEGT